MLVDGARDLKHRGSTFHPESMAFASWERVLDPGGLAGSAGTGRTVPATALPAAVKDVAALF